MTFSFEETKVTSRMSNGVVGIRIDCTEIKATVAQIVQKARYS